MQEIDLTNRYVVVAGINYMFKQYTESCNTYDVETLRELFIEFARFHKKHLDKVSKVPEVNFDGVELDAFLKSVPAKKRVYSAPPLDLLLNPKRKK